MNRFNAFVVKSYASSTRTQKKVACQKTFLIETLLCSVDSTLKSWRQRCKGRKSGAIMPRAELSAGRQKRGMLACVRVWRDAKIFSCDGTPSELEVGGGTPCTLMACGKTPIGTFGCCGTPRTVVGMAGRWEKNETYEDAPVVCRS